MLSEASRQFQGHRRSTWSALRVRCRQATFLEEREHKSIFVCIEIQQVAIPRVHELIPVSKPTIRHRQKQLKQMEDNTANVGTGTVNCTSFADSKEKRHSQENVVIGKEWGHEDGYRY